MKNCLLFTFFSCFTLLCFAQNTNISGTINDYTNVTAVSGTNISVGSSSAFSVGDLVLIIQMQGATINESNSAAFGDLSSIGDAGNYEFATVCAIPNATEVVVNAIQRSYTPSGVVQLVYVPVYVDATITAPLTASPWNGSTGGILTFQCSGALTMNSGIDLQGIGFRGGMISTSTYSCSWTTNILDYFYDISTGRGATKGEGIALYIPTKTAGRGAQANGGGGSNDHNGGGGGGANAGAGGLGGQRIPATTFACKCTAPGEGGKANVYSNAENKVFLGGGGGSGHENNAGEGSGGVNGGGIAIIKANSLIGNGQTINLNGATKPLDCFDGAGGGGAGGTILLDVANYTGTVNISASGTDGGSVYGSGSSNCNGPGGGGGGGVLWVNQATVPANIVFSATGGVSGTILGASQANCTIGGTNGALVGENGSTVSSLSLVHNQCAVQNSVAVSICGSDSLFVGGAWQSTAGVYFDTIASGCCDTTIETTLTIATNNSSTLNQTLCAGDSIVVNGTSYNSTVSGATETIVGGGSNGCDSIVTINLIVLQELSSTLTQTICAGDSIVVNGTSYDSSVTGATEVFTGIGPNSCDSTVTINLTVTSVDVSVANMSPTLTANATSASYQWINCSGMTPIVGATNASFTPTANGSYAVIVTKNTCTDTSVCTTVEGIGFIENDFGSGCILFPNPTDGNFSIELGEVHSTVTISISDLNGKIIQTNRFTNTDLMQVDFEAPAGVYLLKIESGNKKAIVRLVKE